MSIVCFPEDDTFLTVISTRMANQPSNPDEGNEQGGKFPSPFASLLAIDVVDVEHFPDNVIRKRREEARRASGTADPSSSFNAAENDLKSFEGPNVQNFLKGVFGINQSVGEDQTSASLGAADFASYSRAFPLPPERVRKDCDRIPSNGSKDNKATQMVEDQASELLNVNSPFDMKKLMASLTNLPKNVQSQVMSELDRLSALKLDDSEPPAACGDLTSPVQSGAPTCSSNAEGTMEVADGDVRKAGDSKKSDDFDGAFKKPIVAKVMRNASGCLDSKILIYDEEKHTSTGLEYYFQNPYTTELLARRIPVNKRQVFTHHAQKVKTLASVQRRHDLQSSKRLFQVNPIDKVHICPFCKEPLRDQVVFRIHLRLFHGIKLMYACTICTEKCDSERAFYRHTSTHTNSASYTCKVCGDIFQYKMHLTEHVQTHFQLPDVVSSASTANSTGIQPDIITVVEGLGELFTCASCGKMFRDKGRLAQHNRCHNGSPTYKCDTCGETFEIQSNFFKHKLLHSEDSQCTCSTCGMTFSNADNLRRHRRTHLFSTDVKEQTKKAHYSASGQAKDSNSTANPRRCFKRDVPLTCTICKKAFDEEPLFAHHLKTHESNPIYKCDTCGETFRRKTGLLHHELSHSGIFFEME